MTGPRSSPNLLVGLLLATAILGLLAAAGVQEPVVPSPPPVAAAPPPASAAAPTTSTPIDEQGWLDAPSATEPPIALPRFGWDEDEGAPPGDLPRGGGEWGDDWGDDWRTPSLRGRERLRGLVLDAEGRPRGEVTVELHAHRATAGLGALGAVVTAAGGDLLARGRTGPDGVFTLALEGDADLSLRTLNLTARDPGDGGLALADVSYRAPDPQGLLDVGELRLRPAHRLEVRALGDGQPLAGAAVGITLRSGAASSELSGFTDASGAIAVDVCGAEPGPEVRLVLQSTGRASVQRELAPVSGPLSIAVDLPPQVVMWGRVVDAQGRPVPLARVTARPTRPDLVEGHVTADAEGRFVFGGLAEGPHAVQARAPGGAWAPADLEVALPSPELVLRLEVPGAILITLVPPHDGPLAGVELELLRAGAAAGAWAPAVWDEPRVPDEWGDDWADDWEAEGADDAGRAERERERQERKAAALRASRLAKDERLLLGLTPGRYWVRARDPRSQTASAPVELLVGPGAEESVTLELVPER